MTTLPAPPPAFAQRKRRILAQLAVPDAEYTDASPKGSVDAGIRDLIDEINALDGLVTTSSCGGRVSVFLEGRKAAAAARGQGQAEDAPGVAEGEDDAAAGGAGRATTTTAGVGGKGGGGTWLFVSHDPVQRRGGDDDEEELQELFGLRGDGWETGRATEETAANGEDDERLIHFKFEPMILHILAASPEHAQLALRCGLQAGFRESGAVSLVGAAAGEPPTPMVAIRCMGLTFESLVGVEAKGRRHRTVPPGYLGTLLRVANERFAENAKRIERFRAALREAAAPGRRRGGWEDAAARRERKRAEGLRRAAELRQLQMQQQASSPAEEGLGDR